MNEDLEDKTDYIDIFNSDKEDIILWIEPWGLEFKVSPNDTVTITGIGPKRGRFTIYYLKNQITVCAWPGSKVTVIKNDVKVEEIVDSLRVPPIPGWEDLFDTIWFKSSNN